MDVGKGRLTTEDTECTEGAAMEKNNVLKEFFFAGKKVLSVSSVISVVKVCSNFLTRDCAANHGFKEKRRPAKECLFHSKIAQELQ